MSHHSQGVSVQLAHMRKVRQKVSTQLYMECEAHGSCSCGSGKAAGECCNPDAVCTCVGEDKGTPEME